MKEKFLFFRLSLIFGILALALGLFRLQVLRGNEYRQMAKENRVRRLLVSGPRGVVFDRHGEILAKNVPVFKLKEGDKETIISREEALALQAEGKEEALYIDYSRFYPQGEIFAHVTGYLGEVGEEEMKNMGAGKYQSGDFIGKTGIEAYYEDELRGKAGGELVEVDTGGKILRRIGKVDPLPGHDLSLAIDADLQKVARSEMKDKKGAVIASNPQTGEILVLYSSPSFDPNAFVTRRSEETIANLLSDLVNRPLVNRAIAGLYPPGSTFKMVVAAAGLEEGKITKNTLINDPGVISVGVYSYANWYWTSYRRTEGAINVVRAIGRSTDTFFYKLGEMVGVESIVKWAEKFGLDKVYGLDLGGELAGFLPTPDWKERVKGEPWFLGNTYHLAIGQGDLALTPLGVNMMTAVIANGGKLCRPKMLKVTDLDKDTSCREIGLKKETIEVIKEGMIGACSKGGTASVFVDFKPMGLTTRQIACKTGTAEYAEGEKIKTHAWFTVFLSSPVKNAEISGGDNSGIAVTVLVEGGGEGSSIAAPIAKKILTEYFKEK